MDEFVTSFNICDESISKHVVARPCKFDKRVYIKPKPKFDERVYIKPKPNRYDFVYVYEYLAKEYNLSFPLTNFQTEMLKTINVASSQLHANNWAFRSVFRYFSIT